jgi:hypothetical protein
VQESKQDLVREAGTDPDNELVEIEEQDEAPRQPRSPWFYIIWALVILCIIGFAIFGITTLMHIPPTIEKDTGFIPALQTFKF